jgi:hypothetical protein
MWDTLCIPDFDSPFFNHPSINRRARDRAAGLRFDFTHISAGMHTEVLVILLAFMATLTIVEPGAGA